MLLPLCIKKVFLNKVKGFQADVICSQETKLTKEI